MQPLRYGESDMNDSVSSKKCVLEIVEEGDGWALRLIRDGAEPWPIVYSPRPIEVRHALEPGTAPEVAKLQHALRRASHYLDWAAFHHVTAKSAQALLRAEALAAWPERHEADEALLERMRTPPEEDEQSTQCAMCLEAHQLLTNAGIADGDLIDKVGDAIEAMERAAQPPEADTPTNRMQEKHDAARDAHDAVRWRTLVAGMFGGQHDEFLVFWNDPEDGDSYPVSGEELAARIDAMQARSTPTKEVSK
jgi:hypothetical protein